MAQKFTDSAVANIVENDIQNFARAITDSYCQNQPSAQNMDTATYTQVYLNVFKQTLQSLEKQIEIIRQKEIEDLGSMFK